jgi:hypothetical protein
MAMKYKPRANNALIELVELLCMSITNECVCVCVCVWQSEIFYTESTTQTRNVNGHVKILYKLHSSAIFLKFNHTVLLLVVREPDETRLSSAHGSSPSLIDFYSWIS